MRAVLAVNGEAVEGRNMNNNSAANRLQKRCFTTVNALFYVYTFSFVTLNCLIVLFWWNWSDPKSRFSFYAFIIYHKVV